MRTTPGQPIPEGEFRAMMDELIARGPEIRSYWPPDDYPTYLRSPLWRRIKRRVLKRDNATCVRCGAPAKVVHHRRYTKAVLDGEDDSQLASLCDDCHRTVHYEPSGRVRNSWNEAEAIFLERPPITPVTRRSAVETYYRATSTRS